MNQTLCQYKENGTRCTEMITIKPGGGTRPKWCPEHKIEIRRQKQLKWYHEHGQGGRELKKLTLDDLRTQCIVVPEIPEVKKTAVSITPDDFIHLDPRVENLFPNMERGFAVL